MMEASFDTEESFDDPSCLAPQPPGSVSPAKRQIREVKETKITVSTPELHPLLLLSSIFHPPSSSVLFVSSVDFKLRSRCIVGSAGVTPGFPSLHIGNHVSLNEEAIQES